MKTGSTAGVTPSKEDDPERVILDLLADRDPGKTICPSEAARILGGCDFPRFMAPVRNAARKLVGEGRIEVTQKGEPVDLDSARGPVRLRARDI